MNALNYSFGNTLRFGVLALLIGTSSPNLFAQSEDQEAQTASSHALTHGPVFSYGLAVPLRTSALSATPVETNVTTGTAVPDGPYSSAARPVVAPDPDSSPDRVALHAPRVAPVYNRYIEPFETAQHLTRTQAMVFGFHQSISPYFLLTIVAASGYEQARNSAPNYGTNIGSFGERLGAAAIRDTSQSVFSDSLMAPLLHQDPRFYIQGTQHGVFERVAYAASRVVVTRSSDDGHLMPNYSQVAGYAEAAALTNAYYPDVNVGFEQTAKSLGGSLLGLAFSNVVREFLPDILRVTHLQRFE